MHDNYDIDQQEADCLYSYWSSFASLGTGIQSELEKMKKNWKVRSSCISIILNKTFSVYRVIYYEYYQTAFSILKQMQRKQKKLQQKNKEEIIKILKHIFIPFNRLF